MKSMAKKGMKKSMKKKVSKIAKGKYAKSAVLAGRKMKTSGGLKASDLKKSKSGKVVSKKASARGVKLYSKYLLKWNKAVMAARKALGVTGFQAIGGKSAKGQALLKKTRSLYK